MTPTLEFLPDASALANAAAQRFVRILEATLLYRRTADVALAGGSTPRAMNALLAAEPRRRAVAWDRIRFFFGDERCVPPDHPDSNYRMTRETLFDPLGISAEQVFRMHGEDDPHAAAAAYADVLARELGPRPRFDLLFLGMGPDGHTASLFPGTLAAIGRDELVAANWVATFSTWRITLTPRAINDAAQVVIACSGAEKADALHGVLEGPADPERYPVQIVAPTDGDLHWLIDEPAAAKLANRVGAGARPSSG